MSKNYYDILGVPKGASQAEIKTAYRKLARECHPDRCGDSGDDGERFKDISAAYKVLGDPEKRKLYDEFGEDGVHDGFDPEQARQYARWQQAGPGGGGRADFEDLFSGGRPGNGVDLGDLFGGQGGGGGGGFGDLFGSMFSGGGRRASGPRRGGSLSADMRLSFAEAVLGTQREIAFRRPEASGGPSRTANLSVRVPPGVDDGQVIRLAGQGMPGPNGGPAGDLLITVSVEPHPYLRRDGRDLALDLPVTVGEALLGASVSIPVLDGRVTLKVPPGSQNGTRLRLRGKGVPAHKSQPAGDLYVVLAVTLPDPKADPVAAEQAAATLDALYQGDVRAKLAA